MNRKVAAFSIYDSFFNLISQRIQGMQCGMRKLNSSSFNM